MSSAERERKSDQKRRPRSARPGGLPQGISRTLQLVTPPVVWRFARRLRGVERLLEGPLPSWQVASERATGWENPEIVEKALAAALKVRNGVAAFERDSRAHDRTLYSAPILAALLLAVDRYRRLNVIDFGGGLGSNYFQNIKLLRALTGAPAAWNVVELPALAQVGDQQFGTAELRFHTDLAGARMDDAVLLFTGSLQYIPDVFDFLEEAVRGIDIIALDRVLVSRRPEHEIYVQRLDPQRFDDVTLPTWCFSIDALTRWFEARGFSLVEHFKPPPQRLYENCGLLFVRSPP